MAEDADDRNECKGDEDERADAEADPDRGANAEEGARGEGKRGDNELEEQNGEGELLEIVPGRIRLSAPVVRLRRCVLQDGALGVRMTYTC